MSNLLADKSLLLVHELVQTNGGQIEAESEPGVVTTFTLTFGR